MFSSGPKYQKLVTNLRLAINRLKLLEKKKSELAIKARREIADYLLAGKEERARIRIEHIIREDYLVEAMELVEMYCDLIVARIGVIQSTKELDEGLEEPISSILWAAPRLQSEVPELVVVSDQLGLKYGKAFVHSCRSNALNVVNEKLLHKLSVQAPPGRLVEHYMVEIAKSFNITYVSPPEHSSVGDAVDLLAVDLQSSRNDSSKFQAVSGRTGGGAIPVLFPQPGPLQYPAQASAPLFGAGPVPAPRSMPTGYCDASPVLPAVPTSDLSSDGYSGLPADDVNFDDLTKRFENLKKRK